MKSKQMICDDCESKEIEIIELRKLFHKKVEWLKEQLCLDKKKCKVNFNCESCYKINKAFEGVK